MNDVGIEFQNINEFYKALFQDIKVGILVADIHTKHLLYANPAICDLLGYTTEELLELSVKDIHPPDSLEDIFLEFDAQASGEKLFAYDIPFLAKDGSIIPTVVSANSMSFDGMQCSIGAIIDVTEHKRAEEISVEQEEKYRTFFENSTDAMLIIKDGLFIDCNMATVNMLGYEKKEDCLNTHPSELSPEFQPDGKKSYDKAIEMMNIAIANGAHHFEWDHRKKDGEVFPVEVSLTVVPSDDDIILHTVWRDISRRKKTEEEMLRMQKLKGISTLAGGIAHDFNNVLMGVFGNISMAKHKLDKNHSAYAFIREAEKAMDRATGLSNQLLTFAKGGAPLKDTIQIEKLVKETSLFTLSGSNVKPFFEINERVWSIEADEGQIQQVISNLIINSDQAMPNGGNLYITIENVEVLKDPLPGLTVGCYVKITVRDEGIGIKAKDIERIFDPYFSTKHTGNGLGLATVYSIIRQHGGYIGVTSEPGKGAVFTLYLPALEGRESSDVSTDTTNLPSTRKCARILVMDDDECILETTSQMLINNGFSVESVRNGQQAIGSFREAFDSGNPFDAVLMDLTIPGGMGGKEVVKEILDISPEAKVIVVSGYSNDPIMADYGSYGFAGRLVKPFLTKTLIKELARIIID